MFLVRLDRFFGVKVPNMDHLVIAGYHICGSRRELTVSNPVVVLFQSVLEASVDSGPNLD